MWPMAVGTRQRFALSGEGPARQVLTSTLFPQPRGRGLGIWNPLGLWSPSPRGLGIPLARLKPAKLSKQSNSFLPSLTAHEGF